VTFGSRAKGSKAEIEVAKLLQVWWAPVEIGEWARTPLSGGWSKPSVRAGFKSAGDIMTTCKTFPFCLEVKRREGWSWDRFVAGGKSPVWGWWEQAEKAAELQGSQPMMWFRKNHMPWWVMVPSEMTLSAWWACAAPLYAARSAFMLATDLLRLDPVAAAFG
jgi:hypothetical protein